MRRLRYAVRRGRLKLVERGLYAVVPPGVESFTPDRFLVAAALRSDAVLAYHCALELLGLAHSVYRDVFYVTARPRKDVRLPGGRVRALRHPRPLRARGAEDFGVETHERAGVKLRLTGPERTLVDSFLLPRYAGGIEEVMEAARSVSALDLDRLERYLTLLDHRRAFAIMGFVLEQAAERLFVPGALLDRLAAHRPPARIYLDKRQRGGAAAVPVEPHRARALGAGGGACRRLARTTSRGSPEPPGSGPTRWRRSSGWAASWTRSGAIHSSGIG